MKIFRRILALSLALMLSISPVLSVRASDIETLSEELPTYEQVMQAYIPVVSDDFSNPGDTIVGISSQASNDNTIFRETDDSGNSYIKFYKAAGGNEYANFKHPVEDAEGKFLFEADIRWDNPGSRLVVYNLGGTKKPFMYIQNGKLTFNSSDGSKSVSLNPGEWYKITYAIDIDNGKFDAFVNEERVVTEKSTPAGYDGFKGFRFQTAALSNSADMTESENKDFYIDNVEFYQVYVSPYDKFLKDKLLLTSDDFSDPSNTLVDFSENAISANTVFTETKADNTYVKFYKAGVSDTYVNINHTLEKPTAITFEADIRWDNPGLCVQFMSRPDNKILMYAQNGKLVFCSPKSVDGTINDTEVTIEKGVWYKVTYAIDLMSGRYDAFVNEEQVVSKKDIPTDTKSLTEIRLQTTVLKYSMDTTESEEKDFLLDNIKWYILKGGLDAPVEITPNGGGAFTSESKVMGWIAAQDNLTAISPYEGKYFAGGEKKVSTNAFICRNGEYLVPVDVFQQVFSVTADLDKNVLTVGQAVLVLGEQKIRIAGNEFAISEAACIVDGITYIPFFAYANYATDKFVSESEYGDVILTDSALTFTDKERFEVDLFLTKTRPTAAQIQEDYMASGNANSHPRIWKDAEGFAELKRMAETDATAKKWWLEIKSEADALVSSGVISPDDDSYNFSRNTVHATKLAAIRNLCKETRLLGLAYNITGDTKYAELLKNKFLYVIEKNPSWYDGKKEINYLEHGQLAEACGICYDWIYNYLTEEERTIIAEWAYKGVLVAIREAYYAGASGDYWWVTSELNWNSVISGGEIVLALSLADEYPEIAFDAIEKAMRSGEYSLCNWAPDGGWHEGNSYARYTAQYLEYEFSALDSVLGTIYDREKSRGVQDASFYMYYIDSFSGGSVNFGDSDTAHAKVLGFYWANLYQSAEIGVLLEKWHKLLETDYGTLRDFLYYDPELMANADAVKLELDKFFAGERSQMVVTREGWDNAEQMFACWAGGRMDQSHDHADAGSFVYDVNGYRFVCDLGAKNYTFSGQDWDYFRKRAEAHNVMVINPDESSEPGLLGQKRPGQDLVGHAEVLYVNSGSGGVVSAINLQDMYRKQTSSYIRGFMTTDNRRSLVVRDEVTLTQENSKLYWNLMTLGSITLVDDSTVIITRDDQAVKIEIITNADSIKVSRTDAEPYPFSPQPTDGETMDSMYSRLLVEMVASGEFYIAVKISPMGEGIDPSVPTEAIADWVPEESTEKTQVDTSGNVVTSITADGREIFEGGVRNYRVILSGDDPQVPVIKAIPVAGKKVQIFNGKSPDEATVIVVSDPANPGYSENYVVRYDVIPSYEAIDNRNRFDIINFEVSEETEEKYLGIGFCDGDMGTKWLSEALGAWAIQELAEVQEIHAFGLAFDYSDTREYSFEIAVSNDGINYETVLEKTSAKTAVNGTMAVYTLDKPVTAKFVKFISHGNSTNNKGNLIELAVLGLSNVCGDLDMNHICDDGCGKTYGVCEDADKDHKCDYGCSKTYGVCEDADKDHKCDYGCKSYKGVCSDYNKDHVCDYGCAKAWGKHADADNDGICDYGCEKTFGGEDNAETTLWDEIVKLFAMIIDVFKNFFINLF